MESTRCIIVKFGGSTVLDVEVDLNTVPSSYYFLLFHSSFRIAAHTCLECPKERTTRHLNQLPLEIRQCSVGAWTHRHHYYYFYFQKRRPTSPHSFLLGECVCVCVCVCGVGGGGGGQKGSYFRVCLGVFHCNTRGSNIHVWKEVHVCLEPILLGPRCLSGKDVLIYLSMEFYFR